MRDARCECDVRFTCGFCCRNAKPYFWTLDSEERIYMVSKKQEDSKC